VEAGAFSLQSIRLEHIALKACYQLPGRRRLTPQDLRCGGALPIPARVHKMERAFAASFARKPIEAIILAVYAAVQFSWVW
jgi:hypothetical protein